MYLQVPISAVLLHLTILGKLFTHIFQVQVQVVQFCDSQSVMIKAGNFSRPLQD